MSGLTPEAAELARTLQLARQCAPAGEHDLSRRGVCATAKLLDVCDFPQIAAAMGIEAQSASAPPHDGARVDRAHHAASYSARRARRTASPYALSGTDAAGHMRKLEDIESEVIRMAIARYDGHMSEVARRLGIGRSTLYRKLKELGLEPSEAETNGRGTADEPRHAAG